LGAHVKEGHCACGAGRQRAGYVDGKADVRPAGGRDEDAAWPFGRDVTAHNDNVTGRAVEK